MPYALPLRRIPTLPDAAAKVTNPDGTLTREFITFLRELDAWLERAQAALEELEP